MTSLERSTRSLLDALHADAAWARVSFRTFRAAQDAEEALGLRPPFEIPTEEAPGGKLGPYGPFGVPKGWAL